MKRSLLYLVAVIPAAICLGLIVNYGVNVPSMDEWEMVAFAQQMETNGLHFSDLYAQHNEHRIFFARIAYLSIASFTEFNTVALMLFSFLMISLSAFLVVNYIGRRNEVPEKKRYFFTALITFLIYSLVQYENLLWGFQIGFIMVLTLSVLSFYFLYRAFEAETKKQRNIYFCLAVLAAFIDSFSHSQGLITWITVAVLMAFISQKKVLRSPYFLTWSAAAVFTWGIYFYQYTKPEHHPSLTFLLDEPGKFISYFLSILGNAVSGNLKSMVALFGLLIVAFLLIAVVIIWKRKQLKSFFFPLALALNSLFILGSISLGRAGFGVEQSLASRYTSFSIYAVVGLCLLWMELKDKQAKKSVMKNISVLVLVVFAVTIPVGLAEGFQQGGKIRADREYSAYVLKTNQQQPGQILSRLYPWPDSVKSRVVYLEKHHLNVFASSKYDVPAILKDTTVAKSNNELLLLQQNSLQFAPDFMVVVRPVVKSQYKDKIQSLYVDINGQLFPLYFNPERADMPADPQSIYDVSAISFDVMPKGLLHVKFKALSADTSFYYEVDPGWVFERP